MANTGRLRGFVGQRMAVKRSGFTILRYASVIVPGTYLYLAPNARCQVEAFMWAGSTSNSTGNGGAGGGEAVYKKFISGALQQIPITVAAGGQNGNPGNPTTLTLPNGVVITANPGLVVAGGSTAGAGGSGGNGDLNRSGGAGGTISSAGAAGQFGGAGGLAGGGGQGGGGGSGGFSDFGDILGGAGGAGLAAGFSPGGGGGGQGGLAKGGDGQIIMIFTRLRTT